MTGMLQSALARRTPQALIRVFVLVGALFAALPAVAAELLMFDQEYCPWCEAWNDEVGGIYHLSDEGARAPLRRIDIHDPLPGDISLSTRIAYTPTFVLLEDGREVGRLEGYSPHFFWPMLNRLFERSPAAGAETLSN